MRTIILVVSVAAIALALTVAALGPGVRFGLWDYGAALGWLRTLALPTLVAAGLAGLAFLLALWKARGLALVALVAAAGAGAAAYAPIKMRELVRANPFIHDVTTDFENPPAIIAGADWPRKNPPDYVGAEKVRDSGMTVAEAQRAAFPDIAPLMLETDLSAAREQARAAILAMGMEILAEGPAGDSSGDGWRIEAAATSFWYGFKDDFVVRLAPREEGGVRIDVRSKSRVGGSDLGANARRTREFLKRMQAAA
ncbi:DUF1499 domain-containing protein [Amphiplicatus metriothermophilus]|uniref:DUF1499 domain-containing protein n=1 Tax=Amphiplicatus metriothermophilus TaxID=1519374 RepID=A0A239PV36_9PROT|nr:DUF1499 domain-containing protein [Amphiplicatus metriothermophilus]MBB5519597.1 uncharacterized protein (DUF1499 family) [Amphiplicatus metriothermophilus]SNT74161.1 Protein of unknown function [Amphiplicatus metriothermophilus]